MAAFAALLLALVGGSTEAMAQQGPAVVAQKFDLRTVAPPAAVQAPLVTASATAVAPATINNPSRTVILSTAPRPTSGVTTPPSGAVAIRPAVSHTSLWPMIYANRVGAALDEQQYCIAVAIYHEARGEPFDGQLAVAEVIMNRAASGRYPTDWCSVVKQPWQFSFVRNGRFPSVNEASPAWSYAQALTRIAVNKQADALPDDVLWYHADYVAPGWGRRLSRVDKIGAHIFYRA